LMNKIFSMIKLNILHLSSENWIQIPNKEKQSTLKQKQHTLHNN
jgi:hypothetical protein